MKPSRELFTQFCLVIGIALVVPSISAASNMEQSSEHTCEFSAWDLGNYPPSNLKEAQALERNANCGDGRLCLISVWDRGNYPPANLDEAQASSEMTDCSEGDICQIVAGGQPSLNFAPYSGLNAHAISEDRAGYSAITCDSCVTVHGFGAQTTACDLAGDCTPERISDPRIPIEVLRQAEYATSTGC